VTGASIAANVLLAGAVQVGTVAVWAAVALALLLIALPYATEPAL
jgi:hypothetical protein